MKTTEDRAKDLIAKWDVEKGEQWSNCSDEIADIMVEFMEDQNNQIVSIFKKATKNRRWYKNWEKKILKLCGATIND